jgi:predicted nucleic acid-binding protein
VFCRRASGHDVMIARITFVEVTAALNRNVRERRFSTVQRDQAWRLFRTHCRKQYAVTAPDIATLRRAERLLFRYTLRAYDAIQMASALQARPVALSLTSDFRFGTADRAQANAARNEGLTVELIS